jgi:hypothetical protein
MGGRIWLESPGTDGEGTTFFFTLQYAPVVISPLVDQPVLSGGSPQ